MLPFNIKGVIGCYSIENSLQNQNFLKLVEGNPFPDLIYDYELIKDIDGLRFPAYFQGWYQVQIDNGKTSYITENFFRDNIDIIHEDLKYTSSLSEEFQKLISDIDKYDSIALHIRHGDYENYPRFGFCSKEYYQNAMNLITQNLSNPKFYIFTEDPEWVEKNLEIKYPYEVIIFNEMNNSPGRGFAELLHSMSRCNHFILANSTFSWWAAFLSENKNKKIISPKPWFQDRSHMQLDTIDNVEVINLKNDYSELFKKSDRILFESENIPVMPEIRLDNVLPVSEGFHEIIEIKIKSNCFNALEIHYKISDKNSSFRMFYWKNENFTHWIKLPANADITEIIPYVFERNPEDVIEIESFVIKECDLE